MLAKDMIQEIQDMKANGYSLSEVIKHYAAEPGKRPSEPTIRKYYNMESIPEDVKACYRKDLAFNQEPFYSAVLEIITNNPNSYVSSVYDVLEERFIGSGAFDALPGNAQTLRNFVRYLKETGAVVLDDSRRRVHDYVDTTPAGQQMLIDFGQQNCGGGLTAHFICLLLRMSRILCVFAQDHRFNGEEACRAIYRCFCKLGGRPKELVIDQDAVFIASETYGEIIETQVFKAFLAEQDLRLWVCNKADPQSKGPIENSVKFVKTNFFSARNFTTIDEVVRALPGWLERKNKRIHQATFQVPQEVFDAVEKEALAPLVPSVYESAPMNLILTKVLAKPFINYRSSKYSVPWECCFTCVYYKAIGDKLHIYGTDRRHICTHDINPVRGEINRLAEHRREPSTEWMVIVERMRKKYNCYDFQHFINGFKKENGERHLARQLSAVDRYLDDRKPDSALVSEVMAICCRDFRYKFSQFKAVFNLVEAKLACPGAIQMSDVQKRSLESYQVAFEQRCGR